jgi:hypothetical protein
MILKYLKYRFQPDVPEVPLEPEVPDDPEVPEVPFSPDVPLSALQCKSIQTSSLLKKGEFELEVITFKGPNITTPLSNELVSNSTITNAVGSVALDIVILPIAPTLDTLEHASKYSAI